MFTCKRNLNGKHTIFDRENAVVNLENIFKFSINPSIFTKTRAQKDKDEQAHAHTDELKS